MDEDKKNLCGSKSRDNFKRWHKTLHRSWYGLDVDFIIINKIKILAMIDYKKPNSTTITWAEQIAYDDLMLHGYEVFIAIGKNPKTLMVYKYLGEGKVGDTGMPFIEWESKLREDNKLV